MEWNANTIVAITGAIVTLISSVTAAICSIIRVIQGAKTEDLEVNTTLTRNAAHANQLAVAHAETAAANAIIAASKSADTVSRVETVVKRIENGGTH